MSETPRQEWPEEIWMAEREEHDQCVVTAVLSEHATIVRFDGDKERDRNFHRYVDGDIHNSQERYFTAMLEGERDARNNLLTAYEGKDRAMSELFRLLDANHIDYSHLVS